MLNIGVLMGTLMLGLCIPMILFALPLQDDFELTTETTEKKATIGGLLKLPNFLLQVGIVVVTTFAMGFLGGKQKDHLQSFHLSPLTLDIVLNIGVL